MSRIKLVEALAFYTATTGEDISNELMETLWANSSRDSRLINFNRIKSGKTKALSIEKIHIICDMCGVDPNYLLSK